MVLTKCVRGYMARNDELPHSKNLIGKSPIRLFSMENETTYLNQVSGLRLLVDYLLTLRYFWFLSLGFSGFVISMTPRFTNG